MKSLFKSKNKKIESTKELQNNNVIPYKETGECISKSLSQDIKVIESAIESKVQNEPTIMDNLYSECEQKCQKIINDLSELKTYDLIWSDNFSLNLFDSFDNKQKEFYTEYFTIYLLSLIDNNHINAHHIHHSNSETDSGKIRHWHIEYNQEHFMDMKISILYYEASQETYFKMSFDGLQDIFLSFPLHKNIAMHIIKQLNHKVFSNLHSTLLQYVNNSFTKDILNKNIKTYHKKYDFFKEFVSSYEHRSRDERLNFLMHNIMDGEKTNYGHRESIKTYQDIMKKYEKIMDKSND